ncbi:hypothetical protein DPMN_113238 [Dreissena polymorpha]|uniref:Uncharacterized protein n=1 Tax=Dreissena polymorpha TaxID=45954 RepID=A0A9D4KIQ9_DREPO|nr:hypothetical protein DPMN_113238 [Dreissena polymorpha]
MSTGRPSKISTTTLFGHAVTARTQDDFKEVRSDASPAPHPRTEKSAFDPGVSSTYLPIYHTYRMAYLLYIPTNLFDQRGIHMKDDFKEVRSDASPAPHPRTEKSAFDPGVSSTYLPIYHTYRMAYLLYIPTNLFDQRGIHMKDDFKEVRSDASPAPHPRTEKSAFDPGVSSTYLPIYHTYRMAYLLYIPTNRT